MNLPCHYYVDEAVISISIPLYPAGTPDRIAARAIHAEIHALGALPRYRWGISR